MIADEWPDRRVKASYLCNNNRKQSTTNRYAVVQAISQILANPFVCTTVPRVQAQACHDRGF